MMVADRDFDDGVVSCGDAAVAAGGMYVLCRFLSFFLSAFPSYISGVHHFWVRFFAYVTVFQSNH